MLHNKPHFRALIEALREIGVVALLALLPDVDDESLLHVDDDDMSLEDVEAIEDNAGDMSQLELQGESSISGGCSKSSTTCKHGN